MCAPHAWQRTKKKIDLNGRNATQWKKLKHHPSFHKRRPHEPFRHGQSELKYLGHQPPDHSSATKFF
jgi:hypothetical protein